MLQQNIGCDNINIHFIFDLDIRFRYHILYISVAMIPFKFSKVNKQKLILKYLA